MSDDDGWTVSHYCARYGSDESLNFFVDLGAVINLKTNDGKNCLHIAALYGHLDLSKTLIEKHFFDVTMTDNEGWSALHHSARNGSHELVTYFVDMGTDINLKTSTGESCLHIAVRHRHLNLFEALIDDHNFVLCTTNDRRTAILLSATEGTYELVAYLALVGATIELKKNLGCKGLHIAALNGNLDLCKKLINKYKFDVFMADNDGWTAPHHSAKNGSYELVTYFFNMGFDISLATNHGENCLHIAAIHGHLKLCKDLVDKHNFDVHTADNNGWTALHHSAKNGSYELTTYFADMGTPVEFQNNMGWNCLHIAAHSGHLRICKILVEKYHLDIDVADNCGWTALHHSAKNGSLELFTFFVDIGTDINLKTNDGRNCLHIAALFGHLRLCKTLVDKHNFDVCTTDNEGWAALHHSVENGSYELVTYFAEIETNINLRTNNGKNCLHIAVLKGHLNLCKIILHKYNFDLKTADDCGWSALHYSAKNGSYELLKYFVDRGTEINQKTNDGRNCLHIAAKNGYLNLCKTLVEKHDFDVCMADNDGLAAIHHSVLNGSDELVTYFADMGTNTNLTTNHGRNCLHIAALSGHFNLCKTFIEKHDFNVNLADNNGWAALHHSIKSGSYELVTYFCDIGTDINIRTNHGKNCLHIAALSGHINLCKTLVHKHHFDIHMADNDGWTVLHYSAKNGSYELFKYFCDMGTDTNIKTHRGRNCLDIAADSGHLSLCRTFIEKHVFGLCNTDNDGWSALHYSIKNDSHELFTYFADIATVLDVKVNDGKNCLHIAAFLGNLRLCKRLIHKYNFDFRITDNNGWTPLHFSTAKGSQELFTYFSDLGTDIDIKTNMGWNCLHIAALYGHLNLCKTLINRLKFDIKVTDNDGWRAFHLSAKNGSLELLKFFVDIGADINLKTNDGSNCLHIAAFNGHLNLCKRLIHKHNFDVCMTDNDGWTALHHSVESGNHELATYLADIKTNINLETSQGRNCLHIAARNGNLMLCKTFVDKYNFDVNMVDNDGWTSLHHSATKGSRELVAYFVDVKADINLKTNNGQNCLHIAAVYGHLNLCKTLIDNHNFDVHMADKNGWTGLHHSARNGSHELVKYFADIGTDINLKTSNGENCLHIAALYGHLNLCKTLIDYHNFDVHMNDNDGWTGLHYSARNGSYELVKYFWDIRTDTKLQTNKGENCLHIAALYGQFNLFKILIDKYNFDVCMSTDDGYTALHLSVANGSYEIFTYLVDIGTDINLKSNNGMNCLHIAAFYGHLKICKTLIEKYNFDVNIASNGGWTALHHSAATDNYELIRYVADKGIAIDLSNDSGLNCLHIAALRGNLNLCKILIDEHNFDVHLSDKQGWTALHQSARYGSYELVCYFARAEADIKLQTNVGWNCLHIAALFGHLNLCKTLIDKHKFDASLSDNQGWTALHHSARNGSYELVAYFASIGTDMDLKNKDGLNSLHIAADFGHLSLCKTLVGKHNFDVNMADNSGWTALHYSARNGSLDLVKYFADMGTDIHLKTKERKNCLHIAARGGHFELSKTLLDKHGFDVHLTDDDEATALHYSAESGSFDLFHYILDKGSEIYCKTFNMKNVLHLAARNGHFDICEFILKYFIKDFNDNNSKNQHAINGKLYKSQVFYKYRTIFLHAMDTDANTYLHLAAEKNHAKICELLLQYDTEIISLLNRKDETAMEIAKNNDYKDISKVLKGEYERIGMSSFFFLLQF